MNEPVVDDSPSFLNESALKHFDIVEQMFDHQSIIRNAKNPEAGTITTVEIYAV